MTSPNRLRRTLGLVAALAVALCAVASVGAKGTGVTPKPDGAYATKFDAKGAEAAIILDGGKINSATFRVKYKDAKGKVCKPEGYTTDYVQLSVMPKKPKKPKDGKYSFTATQEYQPFEGAKATLSGKFKSKTKATIHLKSSWNGCKTGKLKFPNATWRIGG